MLYQRRTELVDLYEKKKVPQHDLQCRTVLRLGGLIKADST